jgi:hypothetical protein
MDETKVIIIDDSFDSIKKLNNLTTPIRIFDKILIRIMFRKYLVFLLFGVLFGLSLYLDYKYANYVVPDDYIVQSENNGFSDQNINDIHQFRKLMDNKCDSDKNCGNGKCVNSGCRCNDAYITVDNNICNYHQLSGLTTFLLSIFLGICGVDRCFLARGHAGYICVGIIKGLTLGGVLFWWIIDMIATGFVVLPDGNDQSLTPIPSATY